jgi:hypothetical protein
MRRDDMRAADADRQAVADRLRGALDEGRLDLHEYDERLQRTYAAKTYGELDRLLADLPGTAAPAQAPLVPVTSDAPPATAGPDTAGRRPDATRRWLVDMWGDYLSAVAICVGIWGVISVVSGHVGYFWPAWVAGPWGVILLGVTASGLAKGEPQRWAARQERRKIGKG